MSRRFSVHSVTVVVALTIIQSLAAEIPSSSNAATPATGTKTAATPATLLVAPSSLPIVPPLAGNTTAPTTGMQKPPSSNNSASVGSNSERSSYSSVHVDGPYIAMTFDDGPDAKLTPKLLDTLKERHIHATFFVLGQRVVEYPEILQREVAEGHEIGNHSWDHPQLNKLAEGGLQHQMLDTSAAIKSAIGKAPTIMRPPYGATNPRLSRAIEREFGMKVILWSVDPFDWKDPGSKVVESRILSGWKESGGAKSGAIILSHDIHKGTVEAMPETLDALLAKGYKFVTVSELLAMESKTPTTTNSAVAK